MIEWLQKTADVEFPTAQGPGNVAALMRAMLRESIALREKRAIRRGHDRAPLEPR